MSLSPAALQDERARGEIQKLFLVLSKLPPQKQARIKKLIDLFIESESEGEREDISNAVIEIIVPAIRRLRVSEPVDLEEGVSREGRDGVSGYFRQIGKAVRELREKAGMTQVELEEKSGLAQSHISRLEAGKHAPTRTTIDRIAKALNVRPSDIDLLYDEDGD